MALSKGEIYHATMTEWSDGLKKGLEGYLQCGKAIFTFKKLRLWRMDGSHIKSFSHWVTNTLHVSPVTGRRMVQFHTEVGKQLANPECQAGIEKIVTLLPYLHGKSDPEKEDLLKMAKNLTLEDLKNTLLDMQGKGQLATDVCQHIERRTGWQCKKCHKFYFD